MKCSPGSHWCCHHPQGRGSRSFCLSPPLQGCSGSGDPGEYNLRSRTVVCGTCGQPADKSGTQNAGINTMSSGSSTSSVTVTRSYRSMGDSGIGLGDSLVSRNYLLGSSSPRRQVSATPHPGLCWCCWVTSLCWHCPFPAGQCCRGAVPSHLSFSLLFLFELAQGSL